MTPTAAPDFDAQRFLGTWHIVVTNYGFWKHRHDPTVTYEDLGAGRWRDTLRFTSKSFFGGSRAGSLPGIDRAISPGRFVWRGDGLLKLIKSPWWVMLQADDWAVTYFARSNVGTAPGIDIYGRTPDMPPEQIAMILGLVRAHPFLSTVSSNLYATVQGNLSPTRYALS